MTKRAIKKQATPMPDSKTMVDIATLNANYANLKETISSLLGEVRSGNQQSSQQNSEIIKTLGGINKQQEFDSAYQEKCDQERDELRKDINALESRLQTGINANTNAIAGMKGRNIGISAAISVAIGLLTLWVEAHK